MTTTESKIFNISIPGPTGSWVNIGYYTASGDMAMASNGVKTTLTGHLQRETLRSVYQLVKYGGGVARVYAGERSVLIEKV